MCESNSRSPPITGPAIGLVCHRRLRIWPCLRRSGRQCLRRLDAGVEASGPHDFAVRASVVRQRAVIAHGKPALRSLRAPDAAASTASRPASVTIAIRPSVGRDSESYSSYLGFGKTEIFLQTGLDRGNDRLT